MKRSKPYHQWKGLVALLLAVVFLFSSLGFTYYTHYCPFKGTSASFFTEKSCCCSSNNETDIGCCKNTGHEIKIKEKYNATKNLDFKISKVAHAALQHENYDFLVPVMIENKRPLHYSDTSPPGASVAIFIFDRSILI